MTAYTNVDTLPDLRPTLADLLEGLGSKGYIANDSARAAAQTLRWSAAREHVDCEEREIIQRQLVDHVEELENALENISILITRQRPGGGKKPPLTPAAFRDAVSKEVCDVRR